MRSILLWLALAGSCFGFELSGPDVVAPCSGLVDVAVSGLDASTDRVWVPLQPPALDHRILADGTLVFAAPLEPQTIALQCIAVVDGKIEYAIQTIRVSGDIPDDPPDPPDPPVIEWGRKAILMVYEAQDPANDTYYPLYTQSVKDKLTEVAELGWKLYDDDYQPTDVSMMSDPFKTAYPSAVRDAQGKYPWVYVTDGVRTESRHMPRTVEGMLQFLETLK